jgi:hypothetical protein
MRSPSASQLTLPSAEQSQPPIIVEEQGPSSLPKLPNHRSYTTLTMASSPWLLIAIILVILSDFHTLAFAPTFCRRRQQQHFHSHDLVRPLAVISTTRRHLLQQPRLWQGILNAATSDEDPDVIQIESLASEQIAELIEVTFINACMVRLPCSPCRSLSRWDSSLATWSCLLTRFLCRTTST